MKYLLLLCLFISGLAAAAVTQTEFYLTLDEARENLRELSAELHPRQRHLIITHDWSKEFSSTTMGGSHYNPLPGVWGVHLAGWLARLEFMTRDGLQLIACHEMGHHVVRGQSAEEERADYFAVRECLPRVWKARFSKERVLQAASAVAQLRQWMWREQRGVDFPATDCRHQVMLDALQGVEFTPCP